MAEREPHPDSVHKWVLDFLPEQDKWCWGKAAVHQACFVRDNVARLFMTRSMIARHNSAKWDDPVFDECRDFAKVVGGHTSKSIHLPVYGLGDVIRMRDNFHGWTVTVSSPDRDIELPSYLTDRLDDYRGDEGMERYMFEPYADDNRRNFTIGVSGDFDLYAILLCVASQVNQTAVPIN